MKRRIFPLLLIFALCLTACGNKEKDDDELQPTAAVSPSATVSAAPTAQPEQTPDTYDGPLNPLTGMPVDEEYANSRPIAVMMNNIKEALPQLGNSQADIIYEILEEGGITRMLGVFQSVEDVETIGSIRSTRPYYLELVLGHDAILLHAGGSEEAYSKIKQWNVASLDCVNGPYLGSLMWRDQGRIQSHGSVHSVVTTGEKILELLPTYGLRLEHNEDYKYVMQFAEDGTPADGQQALKIKVPFSGYKTGVFIYDSATGKYVVEEYGSAYVDGNTGEQVAVTNVLILKTSCNVIPGDSSGHIAVDLTKGEGWYACGGKMIPILWSKDSISAQLIYTTVDGEPLTLGAGTSYVNIIPLSSKVTVE